MPKRIRVLFPLALVIILMFTTTSLRASGPGDSPSLASAPSLDDIRVAPPIVPNGAGKDAYVPDELIVKFKSGTMHSALAQVESNWGVQVVGKILLPDYALIKVPQDQDPSTVAASLQGERSVELVERNYYRYAYFMPNDPYYSYQWNFPQIQMPQAWDLSNGSGVIVAVVDSGVAYENYGGFVQAPDLVGTTFVAGYNFVNGTSHANDDFGHGTHVTGTIAQTTNNARGVAGIAYGAKIMPVKVLDSTGSGYDSDIANGIKWAADNGAKVINLSLGGPYPSTLTEDAVNYAYNKGVVVVAAAGNDSGSVGYPAAYAKTIAVGATRYDQSRSFYSNYGPQLDLVAPGGDPYVDQNYDGYPDGIVQQTINPNNNPINYADFGYFFGAGTSMAAPHVSGVAALVIARGNATTPDQVRQALLTTAKDLGTPGWDPYYGSGLVQAYDALRWTAPTVPVLPPGVVPRIYLPVIQRIFADG